MKNFKDYMVSEYQMADTRAFDLDLAIDKLHSALAQMDHYNLGIIRNNFPGLLNAASLWADQNPGMNNFKGDQ